MNVLHLNSKRNSYLKPNCLILYMSRDMRFPTMWYVRPAKAQTNLRICADWSELFLVSWIFRNVKLQTEHHLEFLSLKGGCTGSSESTLVKMTHCWESHVVAHMFDINYWLLYHVSHLKISLLSARHSKYENPLVSLPKEQNWQMEGRTDRLMGLFAIYPTFS